jgi:hypothetical protein
VKKGKKRHDWRALEREFLSGKWPTLEAMSKPKKQGGTGISISTLRKQAASRKWNERGTEVERKAAEIAEDLIALDIAKEQRDARRRARKLGLLLQDIGSARLSQQVKRKGVVKTRPLKSESAAIAAIRLGVDLERMALAGSVPDDPPTPPQPAGGLHFIGPTQVNIGPGPQQVARPRFRELTPDELELLARGESLPIKDGDAKPPS